MTETTSPPARSGPLPWAAAYQRVRAKDPDGLALKRSARAAIFVPLVFGATHLLFANPQFSLFGAFGSFALLLLVDFPGRRRTCLLSYLGLFIVGACFIAVGTVLSTHKVAAVAAMAVVGFGVLFAGIVSPQVASASTAALLLFVLPVAVPQPAAAVGPRLLGWMVAGAFCIPASLLLWPRPWHDLLRRRLSATLSAIGRLVPSEGQGAPTVQARSEVTSELTALRKQFAATPYPPTGSVAGAVALAKLVGRVEWVASNAVLLDCDPSALELPSVRSVTTTVADTVRYSASLICDSAGHPVDDPAQILEVQESSRRLDRLIANELDHEVAALLGHGDGPGDPGVGPRSGGDRDSIASQLDPAFRVRALGFATGMMADAVLEAAGAQPVDDRRLGANLDSPEGSFWPRLASHLTVRSVWFRNALRGAIGLALAVAVAEITDVQHGFWVVLGTLSVLRSNALGTGATALRAVGGTTLGFIVGSVIMVGVANHTVMLWALLPVAVLIAGLVPSMISFAAGQAGFTLVVIILFNIIDPSGWRVGLTRVEDVTIGCAVSIVVGLLFWPRGASASLGRALSDAFVTSSGYLADAVDRLTATGHHIDTLPSQRAAHRAYMRLDDAFRQFLAERGAKLVSIETVANLFTGSNRIRLAAYTLSTLPAPPPDPGQPELESVTVAGAVLRDAYAGSHRWYEEFGEMLDGRRGMLDPPPVHDHMLNEVLRRAFEDARAQHRGDRLRATLQMLWAEELLENQRQVQDDLAHSAALFVLARRRHQPTPV
jgi:uncharacterized membrane protein YccC